MDFLRLGSSVRKKVPHRDRGLIIRTGLFEKFLKMCQSTHELSLAVWMQFGYFPGWPWHWDQPLRPAQEDLGRQRRDNRRRKIAFIYTYVHTTHTHEPWPPSPSKGGNRYSETSGTESQSSNKRRKPVEWKYLPFSYWFLKKSEKNKNNPIFVSTLWPVCQQVYYNDTKFH